MISYLASALLLGCGLVNATEMCKNSDYPKYQLAIDRFNQFEAKDYIFDLEQGAGDSDNGVAAFTAGTSEALFGTFIAGVQINFEKCGINLPHTHPRATEIARVLDGELKMGFYPENGGQPKEYTLREGQVMVFPQATLHYQYNDSCRPAKMYAVLNHHDPGTLTLPARLTDFEYEDAIAAAFGAYRGVFNNIADDIPTSSPAQS